MDEDFRANILVIRDWARINLLGKVLLSPIGEVHITMRGIKEVLNQPHKFLREKTIAIYQIRELLATAIFIKTIEDQKDRPFLWHYLQIVIAENNSYIVIREDIQTGSKMLYTIVDGIK